MASATLRLQRLVRRLRNKRLILKPKTEDSLSPRFGAIDPGNGAMVDARTDGHAQPDLVETGHMPEPIDNPEARTISPAPNQSRIARLYRFIRRVYQERYLIAERAINRPIALARVAWENRPGRALTPEEIAQRDEIARRRKMADLLMAEANLYWDRLQNALDRHDFKHKPTTQEGGIRITQHVSFDRIVLQPEAIYFRINTSGLPFGVRITDLMAEDLLVDLSVSCGHKITSEYSDRIGAWFIVERAVGTRGIPDHVRYNDMFESIPASSDGLTVPFGLALNAKRIYYSLGRMYSMLIAGTVGGGKSNFINVILVTLIRRNPPDRLRLILVDLKGGVELQFFEGIPHLISVPEFAPSGIADKNHQVPGVLQWIHSEGERRLSVLRKAEVRNIGRYNAYRKHNRMPHIVLAIDEWADVMYDPGIKRECEELLANVAQRFRAVGIHVIVCTQTPKSEVISTRIKGVLPAKVAFSCSTNPASMVILDNASAKNLNPEGRCIVQWRDEIEIQTPYMNEEIIQAAVRQAVTGEFEDTSKRHDVTQLEILEYALSEDNGYLSRDHLFGVFGKRGITKEELTDWLAELEGQEFIIGTSLYRVAPAAGSRPRRLIPVDENADDIPDEEQSE